METTEPTEKPPRARPSSSAHQERPPSTPAIDRECQKCVAYLTRALDKVGSRPQSLLRALGVVPQSNISNESKLYETDKNGRGVIIRLENSKDSVAAASGHAHGDTVKQHLQVSKDVSLTGTNGTLSKKGSREKTSLPTYQTQSEQKQSPAHSNVTLGRRFTNAATILAEGIRHSAEDILNDGALPSNGGVLTTSPAMENNPKEDGPEKDDVTTIAIECMSCGSDSRAEAGARAFVKGPEPLSIVLCSNRLSSQREVDEVLVHELVHIYGKFAVSLH